MASDSNVVLQELTQGVCAVTQTFFITQRQMNAVASIGHQRMLVQILLLFALDTTQEVHQQCITGLAAITARIQHLKAVTLQRGKEGVPAHTVAHVDKTVEEDESSITLTVATVTNNRPAQVDVTVMTLQDYVGSG